MIINRRDATRQDLNARSHSSEPQQSSCLNYVDLLEVFSRRYRFLSILILLLIFGRSIRLFDTSTVTTRASTAGFHSPIIYGHVHIAKTGGTSLNGILANKFEHVCGHKGYSYDAYQDNERKKQMEVEKEEDGENWSRGRVDPVVMDAIGYEDCDYISHEANWQFWTERFGERKFHGLKMELHVPCRNRIEHLMSQCNYHEVGEYFNHPKQKLACDAKSDEELFDSVNKCFLYLGRYDHELLKHFDVKCFDFDKQFTGYVQHMSQVLNRRRFESQPYVKRETNDPRNKAEECIWDHPTVLEKIDTYLLDTVPYYQFCNSCMGSENEIASGV